MKTKIGFQGDEQAFKAACKQKHENDKVFWKDKSISYDSHRHKQDKVMFVMTWEDSLSNLSFVMNHVKSKAPEIIAQQVTRVIRKGRRDVYILSKDNLKFKQVFHKTLEELKSYHS